MSLTDEMVLEYLKKTNPLTAIDNHDVKDEYACKTGQMPLTIGVSKDLIDGMVNRDSEEGELSEQEINALIRLRDALESLPTSLSFQSLYSVVTGVDSIQKELLESVNNYLNNIQELNEHKLLLKAVVLVLKILEYDLSKNPGPITRGYGFFTVEILSDEKRIENHSIVKELLGRIIEQFNKHYEENPAPMANVC
ncbi:MAG: hypothetical protein P4L79_03430 [Legionella sp.]|uniref:hypothetical protein n=1 Tax=Legionella sp. TaxID=459 RepID=UPI002841F57C|nr:hypothetical protein [Legionella sp.]